MTGAGVHRMTRRAALLCAIAGGVMASTHVAAYYQIPQLIGPRLVVVRLRITSYDRELVLLARSEDIEAKLVEYISTRLADRHVVIPVLGHEEPKPPNLTPQDVVLARVRIDLQRDDEAGEPAVLGSAGVMFERDAKLHVSVHPRRLFTAARDAEDLSAKCFAAAKEQLDLTLIPQLIAEQR